MHVLLLVCTHLAVAIVAVILYRKNVVKITNLVAADTAAVTSRIEALKATDIAAYNKLSSEWKMFVEDGHLLSTKISASSAELQTIIKAVRIYS